MLSDACDLDFGRDERAKIIHNNYLQSCKNEGKFDPTKPNFQEWDSLPEQFKWSNRYVVDIYPVKIRSLKYNSEMYKKAGFSNELYSKQLDAIFLYVQQSDDSKIKNLGLTAEEVKLLEADLDLLGEIEHNRWTTDRILAGWNYGPARDNDERLHPDIIPYHKLSDEIKMYDKEPSVRMFDVL